MYSLCICISSAVSPRSLWKSSPYLSISFFLRRARPSLTWLFPNWIAPFSSSPSHTWSPVSFSQYAPAFSFANTALFALRFYTQMYASPPPAHFSSLFSPLSQQSPSSHHHGLCLFSKVPLGHTRIQCLCPFCFSALCLSCWCVQACSKCLQVCVGLKTMCLFFFSNPCPTSLLNLEQFSGACLWVHSLAVLYSAGLTRGSKLDELLLNVSTK